MNVCNVSFPILLFRRYPASLFPCISHYVLVNRFTFEMFCAVGDRALLFSVSFFLAVFVRVQEGRWEKHRNAGDHIPP